MKKVFLIILLSVFFLTTFSQDYISYYKDKYLGEYYLEIEQYDSAIVCFNSAITRIKGINNDYFPIVTDYLMLARCYMKKGDTLSMINEIEKTCRFVGYVDNVYMMVVFRGDDLSKLYEKDEWVALNNKCEKEINYNDSIAKIVNEMQDADHSIRNEWPSDSAVLAVDKANLIKLEQIIEDYGWPGFHLIGNDNAFFLLLHQPNDIQEKYIKYLKPEVFKGNLSPDKYMQFVDDALYDSNEKQYYGLVNKYTCGKHPYSMVDMEMLNKNRAEIGLISFEKFLELSKLRKEKRAKRKKK